MCSRNFRKMLFSRSIIEINTSPESSFSLVKADIWLVQWAFWITYLAAIGVARVKSIVSIFSFSITVQLRFTSRKSQGKTSQIGSVLVMQNSKVI
jgi:hypothetical protein